MIMMKLIRLHLSACVLNIYVTQNDSNISIQKRQLKALVFVPFIFISRCL